MKRLLSSIALGFICLSAVGPPTAQAQLGGVVYDPANHAQNILQAVRALQEINNQVQQLTNEIRMLENMANDLASLPDDIAAAILQRVTDIDALMRQAQGIGQDVREVDVEYEKVYPKDYGSNPPPQQVLVAEARVRWEQSRSAYKDSLLISAQVVESARQDSANLDKLIGDSQSAAGNLQAQQAGNQIDALQSQQLMQIESMMAAHYRAEAMHRARELAEEARGRARLNSFLSGN